MILNIKKRGDNCEIGRIRVTFILQVQAQEQAVEISMCTEESGGENMPGKNLLMKWPRK